MLTRSSTLRCPNHADTRSASRPAAVDGLAAGSPVGSLGSALPTAGSTSVISLIAPCTPAFLPVDLRSPSPCPCVVPAAERRHHAEAMGSLVRRASLPVLQLHRLRLRRRVVRVAEVDDGGHPGALRQLGQ